jgi:hypothetical protein
VELPFGSILRLIPPLVPKIKDREIIPEIKVSNGFEKVSDLPMPLTLWAESVEKATIGHLATWEEINGERENVRTG